MTDARRDIFEAIERATGDVAPNGRDAIAEEAAGLLGEANRIVPSSLGDDLVAAFARSLERLPPGASIAVVEGEGAIVGAVADHLAALGLSRRITVQPVPELESLGWESTGFDLAGTLDEGVAVTLAEAGVAETASLVIRSGGRSGILDTILPLHHVAILRRETLVPYLDDAFARFDLAGNRTLMLVTGPSGTADIEGKLVIGVHGPRTLHVVLVT